MNKYILKSFLIAFSFLLTASFAQAQMMGRWFSNTDTDVNQSAVLQTTQEEKQGAEIWNKLQNKETTCASLDDDQFDLLGEYFMGQMTGTMHTSMNAMLAQRYGENEEKQIHVTLGKQWSGCDASAAETNAVSSWMPMMWGNVSIGQSGYSPSKYGTMMSGGWGYGSGFVGLVVMIVWWILILTGIVTFVRWVGGHSKNDIGSSAIDILKERYAQGEIDKETFEKMKKDLL
jgi:putative membrane protein